MIAYITTQGSRITREGTRLLVRKEKDIYHTLFTHKLKQLIVCGNINFTAAAMRLLLHLGIDTVFLRHDGRYLGRLAGAESKNVFLRQRQFRLAADTEFCLQLAKSIVRGKLANQAALLQRIKRSRRISAAGRAAEKIRTLMDRLPSAAGLDQVRGLEGLAGATYFEGLRCGFIRDWRFLKRIRRPPTDPVNALLSLVYTFLINRAYTAVRLAGLDPYPGSLHGLEYGRHSLPLDLVEEFRPIIADTLTLSLFNLGILKENDFDIRRTEAPAMAGAESEVDIEAVCRDPLGRLGYDEEEDISDLEGPQTQADSPEEEGRNGKLPVRLVSDAFKRVIEAFERKMATEFNHPAAEKRMDYTKALAFQARRMRLVIEGETDLYEPLLLR